MTKFPSLCAWILFLLALLAVGGTSSNAETRFAVADGNWNDPAVWSVSPNGAAGAAIPGAGDTVTLAEGSMTHTVIVPAGYSASCTALIIGAMPRNGASGTIELAGATSSLVVGGDVVILGPSEAATRSINVRAGTLSVGGSLSLGQGQTWKQNVAVCKVVITDGTVSVARDLRFNVPAGGASAQCQIVMSGGHGTFNLGGAFTVANGLGMIVPGTASNFNFNGSVPQMIPFTAEIRYNNLHINNTSSVGASVAAASTDAVVDGDLRIERGTLRNGGRPITGSTRGTFHVADSATFMVSGASSMAQGFGSSYFGPAATIYYAGFDQQIAPGDYGNLVIASAGKGQSAKTLPAGVHVRGNLTIAPGNDVTIVTAAGDVTIDGDLVIGANNWFMAGAASLTVGGDIINNGTFAAGTGRVKLDGTTQMIAGTAGTRFNTLAVASKSLSLDNDVAVAGELRMEGGPITTGDHTIAIGDDTLSTGSLVRNSGAIVGKVRRWVSSSMSEVIFPVGTESAYRPARVVLTTPLVVSGVLTAAFIDAAPATTGLPLTDGETGISSIGQEGFWSIAAEEGLAGGLYDVELTAERFSGVASPAALRVLKRQDAHKGWELDGAHDDGMGTEATPVARRRGMYGFGDFSIGGDKENPLSEGVAGVQTGVSAGQLRITGVLPNPATDKLKVLMVVSATAPLTLDIVSADGQLVDSPLRGVVYPAGEHQLAVSVSKLASGSYLLRLNAENGRSVTQRFIVVR
jgi:hypothetical protein